MSETTAEPTTEAEAATENVKAPTEPTEAPAEPTTAAFARISHFLSALKASDKAHPRIEDEPEFLAGVRAPDGSYHHLKQRDVESVLAVAAEYFRTGSVRDQLDAAHQHLAAIRQNLDVIFNAHAVCATCCAEHRQAARPNMNFVNVIVDGTGYCHDHVDIANGRLVPKSSSGIIVAGGR
jgi:hypothetical protein